MKMIFTILVSLTIVACSTSKTTPGIEEMNAQGKTPANPSYNASLAAHTM